MAKPELTRNRSGPAEQSPRDYPWLKAYPKDIDWGMEIRPVLLTSLLDRAVAAYGSRTCTYFMGKRLSFAEIGALSDQAAKGLQALGVGKGVKVGLLMPNCPTFVVFYHGDPQGRRHGRQLQSPVQPGGDRAPGPRQRHQGHGDARSCRHLRQGRGAARERRADKAVVASFAPLLPKLKAVA